jgi:hypothetical protein
MAHLLPLLAGLLVFAGAHASDVADRSMHQGFLSQYMGSDASETSRVDYSKFVTSQFNHMKNGGAPDALSHVEKETERAMQKEFANDNSMSIGMSAIGVSLLTLAAMLAVRMRRGLQQAPAYAGSGGHESDMSTALAPASAGNILELRTQESTVRGEVGWSQQSSKNSPPLTFCYATPSGAPAATMKAPETSLVAPYSNSVGGRTQVARILSTPDKGVELIGQTISVCGWVRTKREAAKGKIVFVAINDGSCMGNLQVVIDSGVKGFDDLKIVNTGASMKCTGEIVASGGKDQAVELSIKSAEHSFTVFGGVDAAEYPLSKNGHSFEFLREIAHLRPRSNFIGAVARVRSALALATHEFFRSNDFKYVHTPLITAADCEGGRCR